MLTIAVKARKREVRMGVPLARSGDWARGVHGNIPRKSFIAEAGATSAYAQVP